MSTTRVVNITRDEQYDVFIGRPSKWGNPYHIGRDGDRQTVVWKYERWIRRPAQQHLRDSLHELKGKRLGCFCAPLDCHGDVLVDMVEAYCGED